MQLSGKRGLKTRLLKKPFSSEKPIIPMDRSMGRSIVLSNEVSPHLYVSPAIRILFVPRHIVKVKREVERTPNGYYVVPTPGALKIKEIVFEEGSELTSIGEDTELGGESLFIPERVKVLGSHSLSRFLREIVFDGNSQLERIEDDVFVEPIRGRGDTISIRLPKNVKCVGTLSRYVLVDASDNDRFCNGSNALYERMEAAEGEAAEGVTPLALLSVFITSERRFVVPREVCVLGRDCMADLSICEVIFEEGSQLKLIAAAAFHDCWALRFITIPRTVEEIEADAFYSSDGGGIEEVIFEEDSQLRIIGFQAFYGCLIDSILIPRHVEWIDERCFDGCAFLTLVVFEEGSELEDIGERAFGDLEVSLPGVK
jgi:hypothetical protein